MATGMLNNKSKQTTTRIPLDTLDELKQVKEDSESTAGFIVTAIKREIKRRQREKSKLDESKG
ncbi:hypothetical protein Rin_00008560 [Candidatus Regiella insecticola 5.15]|uniref:Uncharacterized protein n=1 Tax=Candidatus Regiella insecticola 5.15 TaxID=1005043 RepID=G2GYJ4_9ENTR|nr:YlcI/YnfO family protein [Candidatus Regiella insecticola]EGY29192.1 hypothetical protein Rin_00008560 [Candidatus Regiella insecticola 5.15]